MEFIRGTYNLQPKHQACVATIGSFDGVHLGHQAILHTLAAKAREYNLPATVITFEPLPREYFASRAAAAAPLRLMPLREKITHLAELGIDRILCIPFNARTAAQEATSFLEKTLVQNLQIRYLIVGHDFSFGRNRAGDFNLLQTAGKQHGFEIENLSTLSLGNRRISSTRIRDLLTQSDLKTASILLGRPYALSGRVVSGDQRGRTLGFPTANIHLKNLHPPVSGVFAVKATLASNNTCHNGIANLGVRPTVDGSKLTLEIHLFDFTGNLYGQRLHIAFLHKIRAERKFASIGALKTAIEQDYQQAKQYFLAPS